MGDACAVYARAAINSPSLRPLCLRSAAVELSKGLLKKAEFKMDDILDAEKKLRHKIRRHANPTLDKVYEVAERRKLPFKKVSRRAARS